MKKGWRLITSRLDPRAGCKVVYRKGNHYMTFWSGLSLWSRLVGIRLRRRSAKNL